MHCDRRNFVSSLFVSFGNVTCDGMMCGWSENYKLCRLMFVNNAVIVIMPLISVPTTGFVAMNGCVQVKELYCRRSLFMNCRGSGLCVLIVVLDLGVARI